MFESGRSRCIPWSALQTWNVPICDAAGKQLSAFLLLVLAVIKGVLRFASSASCKGSSIVVICSSNVYPTVVTTGWHVHRISRRSYSVLPPNIGAYCTRQNEFVPLYEAQYESAVVPNRLFTTPLAKGKSVMSTISTVVNDAVAAVYVDGSS